MLKNTIPRLVIPLHFTLVHPIRAAFPRRGVDFTYCTFLATWDSALIRQKTDIVQTKDYLHPECVSAFGWYICLAYVDKFHSPLNTFISQKSTLKRLMQSRVRKSFFYRMALIMLEIEHMHEPLKNNRVFGLIACSCARTKTKTNLKTQVSVRSR